MDAEDTVPLWYFGIHVAFFVLLVMALLWGLFQLYWPVDGGEVIPFGPLAFIAPS